MHAVLARLMVRGTRGAHAVKLDAAADAAVLDLAAAADSRLPLARHGDFCERDLLTVLSSLRDGVCGNGGACTSIHN